MADVRFEPNKDALDALLHSDGVKTAVDAAAQRILDRANSTLTDPDENDLYQTSSSGQGRRYRARVYAAGTYAQRSNAKWNTLVRALGLG